MGKINFVSFFLLGSRKVLSHLILRIRNGGQAKTDIPKLHE